MKKLPKIYRSNIIKNIKNNKEVCYLKNINVNKKLSVNNILDDIFNGLGYPFNIPVIIETNDRVYETSIVVRTKSNIVTLDNDVIQIEDINNITIK